MAGATMANGKMAKGQAKTGMLPGSDLAEYVDLMEDKFKELTRSMVGGLAITHPFDSAVLAALFYQASLRVSTAPLKRLYDKYLDCRDDGQHILDVSDTGLTCTEVVDRESSGAPLASSARTHEQSIKGIAKIVEEIVQENDLDDADKKRFLDQIIAAMPASNRRERATRASIKSEVSGRLGLGPKSGLSRFAGKAANYVKGFFVEEETVPGRRVRAGEGEYPQAVDVASQDRKAGGYADSITNYFRGRPALTDKVAMRKWLFEQNGYVKVSLEGGDEKVLSYSELQRYFDVEWDATNAHVDMMLKNTLTWIKAVSDILGVPEAELMGKTVKVLPYQTLERGDNDARKYKAMPKEYKGDERSHLLEARVSDEVLTPAGWFASSDKKTYKGCDTGFDYDSRIHGSETDRRHEGWGLRVDFFSERFRRDRC